MTERSGRRVWASIAAALVLLLLLGAAGAWLAARTNPIGQKAHALLGQLEHRRWAWWDQLRQKLHEQGLISEAEHLRDDEIRDELLMMEEEAVAPLIDELHTTDVQTKLFVLSILNEFNDPRINSAAIELLADDSAEVRVKSVELLQHEDAIEATRPLIRLLDDPDYEVRAAAIRALGVIGDETAIDPLTDRIAGPQGAEALTSLGNTGNLSVMPTLVKAMREGGDDERAAAAEALGKLLDGRTSHSTATLIKTLADEHAEVRSKAIQSLRLIGDPRFAEAVAALATDEVAKVRLAVAQSLSSFDDAVAAPVLRRLAEDVDPDVRDAAINGLGNLEDHDSVELLIRLADKDPVEEVREAAIHGLGNIGTHGATEALIRMIAEKQAKAAASPPPASPPLFAESDDSLSYAIRDIDNPQAIDALAKVLDNKSAVVRAAAMQALGKMDDPRALAPLLNVLAKDDREDIHSAIRALGELGDRRAVDPLIKQLIRPAYTSDVADALGEIGDERAVQPLIKQLRIAPATNAHTIVAAIGSIGDPAAIDDLSNIAGQGNNKLSRTAIDALGRIGDPRVAPMLIDLLRKPEPAKTTENPPYSSSFLVYQRYQNIEDSYYGVIIQALGRLGDPQAAPLIIDKLNSGDLKLRRVSMEALGHLGSADAVPVLTRMLDDFNPNIRVNAVKALGQIGDPSGVDALIAKLDDRSSEVRFWTAEALAHIGDRRATEAVERAMEDRSGNNRAVFAYAATMLGSTAAHDALRVALRQETGWRAFAAASALGRCDTPQTREILKNEGLRAKDPEIRKLVQHILDSSLYDALRDQADSNALHVLSHLGDERAMEALQQIRDNALHGDLRLDAMLTIRRIERRLKQATTYNPANSVSGEIAPATAAPRTPSPQSARE